MLKKLLFQIFLLVLSSALSGQKYGHVWQFGTHAGIDFKACNPVPVLTGKNSGFEGCSSISDSIGDLLFYTNSDSVWDKTNHAMPNGNLVAAGGTLSQVIIIPKPQSNTLYYIVTTKVQASGTLTLQYHVVDISLNSGNGDVVSKNNVLSNYVITEQIAATYHQNGTDIWLMAHEYATHNFLAYLVTSAGISPTPVFSGEGPSHFTCPSYMNARGEIKFSPDGTKVAFNANGVGSNDSTNILTLFDFDNATGIVSNPLDLPYSRGEFGLSFSPDNTKLYGATWKAFNFTSGSYNYIYQFDLASGNPNTIINSKQILDSATTVYGSVKIGPDGRIYVARTNSLYVGVINFPNSAGLACNYVSNGFYLGGKTCRFGLNNYIEYKTYCDVTAVSSIQPAQNDNQFFPNPFTSSGTLYSTQLMKDATLAIYNSLGEVVKLLKNISGQQVTIQRENLSTGLYYFQLSQENEIFFKGKILIND